MQDTVDGNGEAQPAAQRARRAVGQKAVVGRAKPSEATEITEPTISVDESDGQVASITVTCKCGHQLVIDCEYTGQTS